MSKIVDMTSRLPELELTKETVHQAVRSIETGDRVEKSVRWLTGIQTYRVPMLTAVLASPQVETSEFGTCELKTIVTDAGSTVTFLTLSPEYAKFIESQGIARQQALDLTATVARSIEALNQLVLRTPVASKSFEELAELSGIQQRYWNPDMNLLQISMYRASAAIGLHACGIDFDTTIQPPYPGHIAGLMNPLKTP